MAFEGGGYLRFDLKPRDTNIWSSQKIPRHLRLETPCLLVFTPPVSSPPVCLPPELRCVAPWCVCPLSLGVSPPGVSAP